MFPSWCERESILQAIYDAHPLVEHAEGAKFAAKKQRIAYFRRENRTLPLAEQYLQRLTLAEIVPKYDERAEICDSTGTLPSDTCTTIFSSAPVPIDWSSLPSSLQPISFMNPSRATRKNDQLGNMIDAVQMALRKMFPHIKFERRGRMEQDAQKSSSNHPSPSPPLGRRPILVDFCCGSGHTGFPLAYLFPQCDVILLEHNTSAIEKANERLKQLQGQTHPPISNVRILHMGLQQFDEPFDVGLGLHACGWLSDIIQRKCFDRQAAFVLAPCCIGKCRAGEGRRITIPVDAQPMDALPIAIDREHGTIYNDVAMTSILTYPRSQLYSTHLTRSEYFHLSSKADYSDSEWNFSSVQTLHHGRFKTAVEWDRILAAKERGYDCSMVKMDPITCTPKNDMIIGVQRGFDREASRMKSSCPFWPAILGLLDVRGRSCALVFNPSNRLLPCSMERHAMKDAFIDGATADQNIGDWKYGTP